MYAKLFASIYQGTLRGKTHSLVVFTNLLAHADGSGWVDIHPRAIADEVGLPVEDVNAALAELEAPDPESRSPEEDGRRLVRLDEHRAWGWRIVNYGKYRAIRSEEDRREQNRLAQQRWRDARKHERNGSKPASAEAKRASDQSAQAEGEGEAEEGNTDSTPAAKAARVPPPAFDGENAELIKPRAVVQLAASWGLPESWGEDAEALGWTSDRILREGERFRQYYTAGKGAGMRRSLKGWRQAWSNWLSKAENFQVVRGGRA